MGDIARSWFKGTDKPLLTGTRLAALEAVADAARAVRAGAAFEGCASRPGFLVVMDSFVFEELADALDALDKEG